MKLLVCFDFYYTVETIYKTHQESYSFLNIFCLMNRCNYCLPAGMKVLLVDQWIETGGTMKAAIQLVEKLGATVVGAFRCLRHPPSLPTTQRQFTSSFKPTRCLLQA